MRKSLWRIKLFFCVVLIIGLFHNNVYGQTVDAEKSQDSQLSNDSESEKNDNKLVVFYFYGKKRCMSCRTIEKFAQEAISKNYAQQIEDGSIEFRVHSYINPEYAHYKKDFELITNSVVISEFENGKINRWENLPDVWKLMRNEEKFHKYIIAEMEEFSSEN